MSDERKYEFEGSYHTLAELSTKVYERASSLPESIRFLYIGNFNALYDIKLEGETQMDNQEIRHAHSRHVMKEILGPLVGVAGIAAIIFVVIYYPNLTTNQFGVIWTAMCLLAGVFATLMTGFLTVKYLHMRASASFGIVLILYFFVPAAMNSAAHSPSRLNIFVANTDSSDIQNIPVNIDLTSAMTVCEYTDKELAKYYGGNNDTFTYYQVSDGRIYSNEKCKDITDYKLMAVSNSVMSLYKTKREAYLHFLSQVK